MSNFCFEMPATKGIQAGRPFYVVNVPMSTLKRLIAFDTGNVLDRSQREVNPVRAKKISKYMQDNPDSYILPAIIGVIDRHPEFVESELSISVGVLKIDMDSEIKLFDGQHRSTGIIDAVESNFDFAHEMIPVQLFMDMGLDERQMAFSDINGHTVKPSTSISDTYNQRNDLPKLVVEMANTLPCFDGYVDFERNVIGRNSAYMFPVKIIKDATARFLSVKLDAVLTDDQRQLAKDFWTVCDKPLMWQAFRGWRDHSADDFREDFISSHGVFLNALGVAGNQVLAQDGNLERLKNLSKLNIKRVDNKDLTGRCICPVTGNMKTDATAIKLTAIKMLCVMDCPVPPDLKTLEAPFFPNTVFPSAKAEPEPEPEAKFISGVEDLPADKEWGQEEMNQLVDYFQEVKGLIPTKAVHKASCLKTTHNLKINPQPAYTSSHFLAPTIVEVFPDLLGEQVDDLAEKFDKAGSEQGLGLTSEEYRINAHCVLVKWGDKPRINLRVVRADLKKVLQEQEAA